MLAAIRAHSVDLPLFFHVVGAIALVGTVSAVGALAWAAKRGQNLPTLARGAFGTLLLGALPAWVVLFAFGSATKSKEGIPSSVNWLNVPVAIASVGLVVLLAATGAAFAWSRQPQSSWQPRAIGALMGVYLAALVFAWWVMTAKPVL